MIKPVNIVIAKRGRDNYLSLCLHYIRRAGEHQNLNIDIYVVDDSIVPCDKTFLKGTTNINVYYTHLEQTSNHFNKAKLLNYGLEIMNQDFRWLSIVDVDMIYSAHFFSVINSLTSLRSYIITTGNYLDKALTDYYMLTLDEPNTYEGIKCSGASQISISPEVYKLFKSIYGDKMYCEDFISWGGEDSDISFKSVDLQRYNLIDRRKIESMWLHLQHNQSKSDHLTKANTELFRRRRIDNSVLLERWLHDQNSYPNLQV
jgi:hypothetical protein